ncbi:hypothetical protein [Acinetobacter pragensis]|uniref:Uncharacterized protein n=1 Tax=Acinetobacter pragensis TaxID=1806892 RepID=A0A151Y5C8_9GAMM|nr:hypothetical protein [Acinetobacter pragensis]KYQ73251.1 hypothetical protein AZH43_07450 [Acinetobacter pragensis]
MRQVNPILLNQLRADYLAIKQLGSPLLACQGMLVPRGMEDYRLLIKSCPRPIVSNEDPAEVQYPGGFTGIVAGVPKTHYTGNLQMLVTEAGHDQIFADYIVANGGMIDCDYYDGRVDSFTRAYFLENCAIRFEMAEYDSDSRSQNMTVSCPIDFNFFGNFANIGSNGTILPGLRQIEGTQELISRVQTVIDTALSATTSLQSSVTRQLGSLFG